MYIQVRSIHTKVNMQVGDFRNYDGAIHFYTEK